MGLILPQLGDGLPVVILELGPPGRTMIFGGQDRPEPFERVSEQRDIQTWYTGNPSATVQVLGVKEEPIKLRGWFQDPFSILDGGPQMRVSILRGLQQGQRLCRFQWGDTVVGYGRVKRTSFTFECMNKVRYEVDFALDKGDEAVALAPVPPLVSTVRDIAADLKQAATLFNDVIEVSRGVAAFGAVSRGPANVFAEE